jgi:hypothetical protein
MNEHIAKIRSDPHKRVPPASKIAEHFCGLLILGWRAMPTIMTEKFLTITDSAIAALNSPLIQSASFPSETTKQWLGEIQQIMQVYNKNGDKKSIINLVWLDEIC